jgi:acyl-CoA synthetase (AMP-forming)/AMP-acid ligase II
VAVYGATEAEPIARLARMEFRPQDRAAVGSGGGLLAGTPVPEIGLRILPDPWGGADTYRTEDEFARLCLPSGKAGEVVVSGPHVLAGYLHGQGDAETKVRAGGTVWHRTGDAGYLDGAGRLWLLGRCAARVRDRHGELYPLAVEAAAHDDPAVRRAALVSYGDGRTLLVEPRGGRRPDPAALAAALPWARLDRVRVVGRIPVDRRHESKVDYPALYRRLK